MSALKRWDYRQRNISSRKNAQQWIVSILKYLFCLGDMLGSERSWKKCYLKARFWLERGSESYFFCWPAVLSIEVKDAVCLRLIGNNDRLNAKKFEFKTNTIFCHFLNKAKCQPQEVTKESTSLLCEPLFRTYQQPCFYTR